MGARNGLLLLRTARALRGRRDGAAFSRKARQCQGGRGFHWLGCRGLRRLLPGNVAHPVSELGAAARSVGRRRRRLALAGGRIGRTLDADMEMMVVTEVG